MWIVDPTEQGKQLGKTNFSHLQWFLRVPSHNWHLEWNFGVYGVLEGEKRGDQGEGERGREGGRGGERDKERESHWRSCETHVIVT